MLFRKTVINLARVQLETADALKQTQSSPQSLSFLLARAMNTFVYLLDKQPGVRFHSAEPQKTIQTGPAICWLYVAGSRGGHLIADERAAGPYSWQGWGKEKADNKKQAAEETLRPVFVDAIRRRGRVRKQIFF